MPAAFISVHGGGDVNEFNDRCLPMHSELTYPEVPTYPPHVEDYAMPPYQVII